jgi:protease II
VAAIDLPKDGGTIDPRTKPKTLVDERYDIDQLRVSPDGRWIAYASAESGQPEINIATYPSFSERRQISTGGAGAVQPLWAADGKELYYVSRERNLMAVDVITTGTTLKTGQPRTLFQSTIIPNPRIHLYAVSPDGKRFYLRESVNNGEDTNEPLYVITNWTSLVGR